MAENQKHLDAIIGREQAITSFFQAATELIKLCIPAVKQALQDKATGRTR